MPNSTNNAASFDEALAAKFDVEALEPRLEAAAEYTGTHDPIETQPEPSVPGK